MSVNQNNKAKWGILGTANIAKKALIPGIRDSKSSELLAVASRKEERAESLAEDFEIPKSFGSYKDLLKDPEINFVYIPLPNHLHGKWTIEAAKKGKHVLCEKPLGTDAKEVEEMFEAAKDNDVKLMEGFMYRFHPQTLRVKELVEQGEIGEPKFFRGAHSFPLVTLDRDDDIRWKEKMGGGSLMDLGTYSVNTIRYLLDEEPTRVLARNEVHPDHTAEAETQAILEFPSGKTGMIDCSFLLEHRANYEVVSQSGKIQAFDTYNPGLGKPVNIETKKGETKKKETIEGVNEYSLEVENFVKSVLGDKTPPISPQDSINHAKTLDAIKRSAEKRGWVEI